MELLRVLNFKISKEMLAKRNEKLSLLWFDQTNPQSPILVVRNFDFGKSKLNDLEIIGLLNLEKR